VVAMLNKYGCVSLGFLPHKDNMNLNIITKQERYVYAVIMCLVICEIKY